MCYCACHVTGPRSPSCRDCLPRHMEEALRATDEALRKMLDEHYALGEHPSGEVEYCQLSACAEAIQRLGANRAILTESTGSPCSCDHHKDMTADEAWGTLP